MHIWINFLTVGSPYNFTLCSSKTSTCSQYTRKIRTSGVTCSLICCLACWSCWVRFSTKLALFSSSSLPSCFCKYQNNNCQHLNWTAFTFSQYLHQDLSFFQLKEAFESHITSLVLSKQWLAVRSIGMFNLYKAGGDGRLCQQIFFTLISLKSTKDWSKFIGQVHYTILAWKRLKTGQVESECCCLKYSEAAKFELQMEWRTFLYYTETEILRNVQNLIYKFKHVLSANTE